MKYCSKCGAEISEEAVICVKCGCAVAADKSKAKDGDENSTGLNVLAFFFPLIGLIMWLVWKTEYPVKAKGIGKCALIGWIVSIVVSIICGIIYGSILGGVLGGLYY